MARASANIWNGAAERPFMVTRGRGARDGERGGGASRRRVYGRFVQRAAGVLPHAPPRQRGRPPATYRRARAGYSAPPFHPPAHSATAARKIRRTLAGVSNVHKLGLFYAVVVPASVCKPRRFPTLKRRAARPMAAVQIPLPEGRTQHLNAWRIAPNLQERMASIAFRDMAASL